MAANTGRVRKGAHADGDGTCDIHLSSGVATLLCRVALEFGHAQTVRKRVCVVVFHQRLVLAITPPPARKNAIGISARLQSSTPITRYGVAACYMRLAPASSLILTRRGDSTTIR